MEELKLAAENRGGGETETGSRGEGSRD